eukprot:2412285-Prymnesium_polylepis.1
MSVDAVAHFSLGRFHGRVNQAGHPRAVTSGNHLYESEAFGTQKLNPRHLLQPEVSKTISPWLPDDDSTVALCF